ncbi:lipopolysaccharide biosynthesis protein [Zhihengliuella sp.]|uniref:lipopolysaccharide biosynthesis protein n=1 Tax=Zhihengliuella sp. TaxID=1954483 RepID=UPI0028123A4D|nr:lipopolysaccharide biosynthesis protein [Zhihengliuella sp.]
MMVTTDGGHARRGIATTAVSQSTKFVVQLLSTIVLARLLAPEDFGLFAMVFAVAGLATVVGDFGLSSAAIQAREFSSRQRSNLWWLSLGLGLLLWGVLWILAPLIENFYDRDGVAEMLRILGVGFVLSSASAQYVADLTRKLRFGWLAVSEIGALVLAFMTAVIAALAGAGAWALVFQQVAYAFALLAMATAAGRWFPGLPRSAPMRSLVKFGGNTLGVQLLSYLSTNVDSIVLGRVAGPVQLGLYDQAYRLFKVPVQQIAAPLTRVALPLLARRQDDLPGFSRYVVVAQTGLSYALGSAFVIGAALSEPVVGLLLGGQWDAAVPLFAVLALGGVFQSMGYVYYWVFLGLGLTGLQLRYSLITRSIMIIAIILSARWGAMGVAIAVTASLALNWVVLTLFPMRRTGLALGEIVGSACRSFAVHAVVGGVLLLVDSVWLATYPDVVRVAAGLITALMIYGSLLSLVPGLRRDVLPLVRQLPFRAR